MSGMTLTELQNVLGDRIKVHSNTNILDDEREKENKTSDIIARLAKQMINNADVILRTDKLREEGKLKDSAITMVVGSGD